MSRRNDKKPRKEAAASDKTVVVEESSRAETFDFTPDPTWRVYVRGMRGKRRSDDPAFTSVREDCIINACSTGKEPFRSGLSPFFVGPCELPWGFEASSAKVVSQNLENAWQFAKVYQSQCEESGDPSDKWRSWAKNGFSDTKAHRFPMGRGAKPAYAFGGLDADGQVQKWGYVESRYRLYAPMYAEAVRRTNGFRQLVKLLQKHGRITLLDFDGWDHEALGLSMADVMYYPKKKMGHGFVIAMLLLGQHVWEEPYGGQDRIDEVCEKVKSPKKRATPDDNESEEDDETGSAASKRSRS